MHRSHIMLAGLSLATAARFAADDGSAAAAATPAVSPGVAEFEFPNLDGKRSFDVATIPAETRLEFLKNGVRAYIANRLNGVHTRHTKDETVAAWFAYDEATKADPLQTAVAKPTADRPAEPDYSEAYDRAVADLVAGNVRRQGSGEPKARKTKDPLIAVVTDVVVRELYDARKAVDPKYNFLTAKKEVGVDGIAYLNALIDAKVEAGTDRAQLLAMLEEKYIGPAKAMLGISTSKKASALPSIL